MAKPTKKNYGKSATAKVEKAKSPGSQKDLKHDPVVSIIMGSDSDFETMKEAAIALKELGIPFEMAVISAHRTPNEMTLFAKTAVERGIRVIIAGAGGAAHLPGMVAAQTEIPVIGVPVAVGYLNGVDALYSIVQMPKGVPVATVAIGNAFNAGILAVQILAFGGEYPSKELMLRLKAYKEYLRELVISKELPRI